MAKRSVGLDLGVPSSVVLKAIPDSGDKYFAGSNGHIYCYSDARVNAKKPKPFMLAETIWEDGYPFVSIVLRGRRQTKSVHTLVCLAFHGPKPSPIYEVRHKDGTRINNAESNLAWGTPAENEADKKRHGTAAIGERHGAAKITEEAVRILRASIPFGLWNTTDAAKVFGVSQSHIRSIVNRRVWKHVK